MCQEASAAVGTGLLGRRGSLTDRWHAEKPAGDGVPTRLRPRRLATRPRLRSPSRRCREARDCGVDVAVRGPPRRDAQAERRPSPRHRGPEPESPCRQHLGARASRVAASVAQRTSTWLSTTRFTTSQPALRSPSVRRHALARSCSTSAATPDRPRTALPSGAQLRSGTTPAVSLAHAPCLRHVHSRNAPSSS